MDKLTLYKKGGKLFYKDKAGKMCSYEGGGPVRFRLPKYQGSPYQTGEIQPINIGKGSGYQLDNPYMEKVIDRNLPSVAEPKKGYGNTMNQIGNYANYATAGLSMIPGGDKRDYNNNKYAQMGLADMNKSQDDQKSMHSTIDSAIPVWGQIHGATTALGNAVDQKDEYGRSKSRVANVAMNMIDPARTINDSVGIWKSGDFWGGLGNIVTFGGVGMDIKDKAVKRAQNEKAFDDNRNAMFNSENTGRTRNDTIYAKNGAQIRKAADHNPNAEIETGEVVMMPEGVSTNQTVMNPNANTSMVSDKAFLVTGKTHEQGGETGQFPQGSYIFSDHLGMNGTVAKKGEKTVAQLAKPHAKALSEMEKRPADRYLNNPLAKKHHENQLETIAQMAEQGKVQANQNQMFKSAIKTAKNYDGLQYAQKGGILEEYATNRMKVDPTFVKQSVSDDPMNYKFNNPDLYKGKEFDSYQNDVDIPAENEPLDIRVEEGVDLGVDSRQGDRPDITTLDAQAGKSQYSGTSNLIQEKVREMIDDNFFDESGNISPEWKQKLKSEYDLSDDEVNKANMETITEGRVGKSVGKLLQDAYGVLGKGKDEQANKVETNVNRRTDRPVINNKLDWAEDIVGQIKENGNILPQQYQSLPDDLKDTLTQIARTGKRASEGSFSPSLDRAYREANEGVASEIDRQKSMTYDTQSQEAAKLDPNYDLVYNRHDGKVQSFGAAFRDAKDGGLDTFTYKGSKYSTKTRSEDPTLAKESDAIKGTRSTKPINQLNIQPATQGRGVVNPTRKLETLQTGGNINNLNTDNMNYNRRPLLSSYQMGGMPKYQGTSDQTSYVNPVGRNPEQMYRKYIPGPTVSTPGRAENKKSQAELMNDIALQAYEANRYKNYQKDSTDYMRTMGPQVRQYVPGPGNIVNPNDTFQHKLDSTYKPVMQQGGQMQQDPNESNEHMNQLMSGDPQAMQQEQMEQPGAEQAEAQGQGQMPMQITQLQPALQQMFMQLSPEQQQQILALPPDQIEIALMTLMQQMQQGQGGQPQAPQQGQPVTEAPAGVMSQLG